MPNYTPALIAELRRRYVETDETTRSIAKNLDITLGQLNRLIRQEGWPLRKHRPPKDLPPAVRLLEEAKALSLPPRSGGEGRRASSDASRGGGNSLAPQAQSPPPPTPPRHAQERAGGGESQAALPDDAPESASAIERIESLVLKELAAEEAARVQLGSAPRLAADAEKSARTLSTLTQTLQTLQRLRAGAAPPSGHTDDDDMPADIDEFRRGLARRIRAFVASRTAGGNAGGSGGAAPVDAA